ncbi:hypothetical protein GW17_00005720 [Ensete ventricosum]|nr:hypothetical protein GW17_00005720 [Ensete ventricosum]
MKQLNDAPPYRSIAPAPSDTSRVADCGSAPIAFGASSPAAKSIREHSCYVIVPYPLFLFYAGTTLRAHRCAMLCGCPAGVSLGLCSGAERPPSGTGEMTPRDLKSRAPASLFSTLVSPPPSALPTEASSLGPHGSHTSCLPEASSVGGSELRMPPKSPKAKKKRFPTRKPHFFKVLLGDFAQRLASPLSTFSSSSSSPSSRPY